MKKNIEPYPTFGGAYTDAYGNKVYIKQIIFNKPATIVFWSDGTKTVSKCHEEDEYSTTVGMLTAVMKKFAGGDFVSKTLRDWSEPVVGSNKVTLSDVRKSYRLSQSDNK